MESFPFLLDILWHSAWILTSCLYNNNNENLVRLIEPYSVIKYIIMTKISTDTDRNQCSTECLSIGHGASVTEIQIL